MKREPIETDDVLHALQLIAARANELAALIEQTRNEAVTTPFLLTAAQQLYVLNSVHEQFRRDLVMHVRDAGASWSAVGTLTGMTRQAAHERFSELDRDSVPD